MAEADVSASDAIPPQSAVCILKHNPLSPDIAGVPGTGKTATVHAVVKQLTKRAEEGVRNRTRTGICISLQFVPHSGDCAVLIC